jgi:hypothetical protein
MSVPFAVPVTVALPCTVFGRLEIVTLWPGARSPIVAMGLFAASTTFTSARTSLPLFVTT